MEDFLTNQIKQCFDDADAIYSRHQIENIPMDCLDFSCGHLMPLAYENGLNNFLQTGLFWNRNSQSLAETFSARKSCVLCQSSFDGIRTIQTNFQTLFWSCVNFFRTTPYNIALVDYIRNVRKGEPFSIKETEDLVSRPGKLVIDILFDKAMQSLIVNKNVAQSLKEIAQKTLILDIKNCGCCEGGNLELQCYDSSDFYRKFER